MGCEVYANCNEIACKAGDGKVIAAFPDVCLSPPSPPAGPVPIPYPDTSFSKDMQNGSKTVMIKGQEVMLKDQSFYKSSPLGDEAATNGLGAGVVTHVITGKTYFVAYSMDVQFEGQNVDRNLDPTTSNHASQPPNEAAPLPNIAMMAVPDPFKATPGGGKKDRHPCPDSGDSHNWECGRKSCPDCWDPPCDDNHNRDQKAYEETQSGSGPEKVNKHKAENQTKGPNDLGAKWENDFLDKTDPETVEHVGYKAHCTKCHSEGDIDVVTHDRVIECKRSSKVLRADQMRENIIPIANKCFPGKKVAVAVPAGEERKTRLHIGQPSWKAAVPDPASGKLEVIDP